MSQQDAMLPLEETLEVEEAWADREPVSHGEFRRLEAKVDALIVALRGGAVGKWTP